MVISLCSEALIMLTLAGRATTIGNDPALIELPYSTMAAGASFLPINDNGNITRMTPVLSSQPLLLSNYNGWHCTGD